MNTISLLEQRVSDLESLIGSSETDLSSNTTIIQHLNQLTLKLHSILDHVAINVSKIIWELMEKMSSTSINKNSDLKKNLICINWDKLYTILQNLKKINELLQSDILHIQYYNISKKMGHKHSIPLLKLWLVSNNINKLIIRSLNLIIM
ncbi:uncharacterized protein SCDLUD_001340 [Saccharomycodes ludwigii]|uniref:uncharacterized protein n=1 Tax=Saccharomycodes ludwigii TaxID=36035 RepID=UPI001E8466A9|nr:hypothetical protein SCDLUD_001340 [Saccharomycodes ludwigii]KAH3901577.1 hypothetical protein SCDLUD_001340 [Saccharomycodes ludwigii]